MDPITVGGLIVGAAGTALAALQAYLAKKQLDLQKDGRSVQLSTEEQSQPQQLNDKPSPINTLHIPTAQLQWKDVLAAVLLSEIPKQLRTINIFDRWSLRDDVTRLRHNPSFSQRLDSVHALESLNDKIILPSHQLGILHSRDEKYLCDNNHPISIAFPAMFLAASAIFFYLRQRYNIHLFFKFPHAIEMIKRIETGSYKPDVCLAGECPSLRLLNKEKIANYEPVLIMPRCEQRVVVPKVPDYRYNSSDITEGKYTLMVDELSVQQFQFEQMKTLNRRRIQVEHREPHETVSVLLSDDVERRVIMWAPLWQVFSLLEVGLVLDDATESSYFFDTLLFFKRSFLLQNAGRRAEALIAAIRDAWAVLLSNQRCLEDTIEKMLGDNEYVETLSRVCGIPQINILRNNALK